jgi:hypothetical protein
LLGVGLFLGDPAVGRASPSYTGVIQGSFGDPVLSGNIISLSRLPVFQDNTATAFYTTNYDSATNAASLTWGTGAFTIPSSILVFQGAAFSGVAPGQEFALGTLSYTNGTSNLNSLIFGATLTMQVGDGLGGVLPITAAVSSVSIYTTVNGGVSAFLDADSVTLSPSTTFYNVYEGASATAILYGSIIGDPELHFNSIALAPNQGGNGFLSPGLPALPEPSGLSLAALAVAAVLGRRRFRRKPLPG